jgi:hypothetical protein
MRDEFLIVGTKRAVHMAKAGESRLFCGEPMPRPRDSVLFVFEPGADFGEHAADCRSCVANARERGLLR